MRRTTAIISTAALTTAAAITGATIWLTQPSYDDIVKSCTDALTQQYKDNGKGRPDACNDVKDDDYNALVVNAAMGDLGWLNDDGDFDKNKMLDDVTQP